jgi:hypothetical protein
VATVASSVTINNTTLTGTLAITPVDLGTSTITIAGPIDVDAAYLNRAITVTGDTTRLADLRIGAGSYLPTSVDLGSTPGRPISVTVTLADPTLAKLSTDPNVMGTASSLTFTNVTCFTQVCANGGGPPLFYVQGIVPGFTKLNISAQGYTPSTATVAVYKLGLTLRSQGTAAVIGSVGDASASNAPVGLSLLDPYSQALVMECTPGLSPCNLNPGAATPSLTLPLDDTTVGSFGSSTAFDSTTGLLYLPYTALRKGFSNFSLGTQPGGYYTTSTASKRVGIASSADKADTTLANVAFITAHDVDTGVGMEVPSGFALTATIPGYYNVPFSITVTDPTIALVTLSPTTAGSTSVSLTTFAYLSNPFYVQGLKAGTTTVTVAGAGYTSRTFTVTVRPGGFVMRQFDNKGYTGGGNYHFFVPFTAAVLNDKGQWVADALMNPQGGGATVTGTLSSTAAGTSNGGTIAAGATQGLYDLQLTTVSGPIGITMGAPSAGFVQPSTYQSVIISTNK